MVGQFKVQFGCADVAQLVEQCFRKAKVGGSNPPIGSNLKCLTLSGPARRGEA